MDENGWLAKRFDESRAQLRALAYRMLGSTSEADDALQEAWLRVARADTHEVANLGGFLTTVVARVCLDLLRSRKSRREESYWGATADAAGAVEEPHVAATAESELGLAEAIGPALLVVLDMLAPAERVSFVLHDMFDLAFDDIAPIIDRTPAAARQLASRARRRVRGAAARSTDLEQRRELVGAFLAAARDGDFDRLIAVLSPDVIVRADELAVHTAAANPRGAPIVGPEMRGAAQVAAAFQGRARGALPALIDGEAGAVWAVGDQVRVAFVFTLRDNKIAEIELVMEPEHIAELDVKIG